LQASQQYAQRAGEAISRAFTSGPGTLTSLNIKLQSLQSELQNVQIGTRRFRELRSEIEQTERALSKAQGLSQAGLLGGLATGLAGLGIGATAVGFLKGSVDAAVELESISKKLSNTLGEQGAGGAIAFTKGLSDQLGLSFKTLAGSFASFTAAASAANVPLQVQKDLFAAVSKAAQQLGLSNYQINGSLFALQQIASKGNVQMEELRGQLAERLPIAFAAAARGLSLTQQELIKLIEGGKLSAREFFPALTKGLNELTKASEGAPTAAQNFQKLQNAFDSLQASFGTSLLPTVTNQVKNLTAVLEGVGVVLAANKLGLGGGILGNAFGVIPIEGAQAVGALKALQAQFNLTDQQARALFTDAIAAEGGKYNPFGQLVIGSKEFDQALASLTDRAIKFRATNRDQTGELQAQQAEASRLLEIAKAREEAEKKILVPARQALADARAIQGLQGLALAQAQEQLKIDQLRRTERQAIADYDKKLSGSGFNRESPAVIEAAAKVEAAGNAVQAALVAGSDALQQASKDAAQRFTDAARQLTEAQLQLSSVRANPEGLNRFLRPDEQFQRVRSAILSLGPELQAAIKRGQELLNSQGVGLGRPLFEGLNNILNNARTGRFASTDGLSEIQQFIKDVNAERDAISGVNNAQKNLQDINLELTQVNSSLRDQVQALVAKQWQVTVNVPGGSASGDVIGVVNGAF
jgi:tape measure domain-containing protein